MPVVSPELYKVQKQFVNSKEEILNNWMAYDLPKEILVNHDIEPAYFINKYGSGVFDYFMGVINRETEIGNCPVMKELLTFFKVREISADELFEICSHFRRSMVDFSYDAGFNSKEMFEEISYIFDENFRGILKFYTDTIFEKLIAARAEALQASEAKEYFLSNMSHEIRTPLNAILGFVNLLIDENISTKHRTYLETILNSGESLLSIINDILDFSKLRSGEFTIDPKVFSIHEELSHTMELFVASASIKNITIISFIDPNIPKELYADALRIKQIVSNLLSNAIKFTKENGVISLKAKYNSNRLIISVRDNGIGISKKDTENIFSAFTQSQDNNIEISGGTGLGLSISRQLAQHMGGNVYVKSKLNRGSTFYLELPIEVKNTELASIDNIDELKKLKIVFYFINEKNRFMLESLITYFEFFNIDIEVVDSLDIDFDIAIFIDNDMSDDWLDNYINDDKLHIALTSTQNNKYDEKAGIVSMTFPLYCSKIRDSFYELLHPNSKLNIKKYKQVQYDAKVLVAEDNEANQELIKILLKKYGLSFDLAQNGLEAFELYKLNSYDLVLMDEQMPVMNGNEAVKKILEYEKNTSKKHTPITAITANVIKGAKEKGLKNGYDAFLGKPIVIKDLEWVLEKYLKQKKQNNIPKTKHENNITDDIISLDSKKLSEELGLDLDELNMLMSLFIKKMDKLLPELKQTIDKKDYKQISLYAHSIKGSSANFRIEFLQNKASEMENMSKKKESSYDYVGAYESIASFIKSMDIK